MYFNYHELDADVIVIGAGMAGLCAALCLLEKDPHLDILILDVEGSKSYVDENLNFSNNQQFCCAKQEKLLELLKKLHINVLDYKENPGLTLVDYDDLYEINGKEEIFDILSTNEKSMLEKLCVQIDSMSRKVSLENPTRFENVLQYDRINVERFLNKLTDNKKIIDVIAQTFLINTGLRFKDVSALFFLAYCNSTRGIRNQFHENSNGIHQFQIEGGAEKIRWKICRILGKETFVKIPEIIELSWDNYCVGIKTRNRYFFASRAIYTLNEAETRNISFYPPLSDEKTIMSNNFIEPTLKMFKITYEKPFWTEKNFSGNVYVMNSSNRNGPIQICLNFCNTDRKLHILTGLAVKNCHKNDIINQLVHYFGNEAKQLVKYEENQASFLEMNFPMGLRSMKCFENIRENTDKIIWAGPETTKEWYGTIAGSLDAGYKGAIRVLYDLKPNILSYDDLHSLSPVQVVISSTTLPEIPEISSYKWYFIVPTFLVALLGVVKLGKYLKNRQVSHN